MIAGRQCSVWVLCAGFVTAQFVTAQQYVISTVAGGAPPVALVTALSAAVSPEGIAADSAGNVYFTSSNSVFRLIRQAR
jgi:hypothetical protein